MTAWERPIKNSRTHWPRSLTPAVRTTGFPVGASGGRDPAAGKIVWKVGQAGFQILQQRARRSGRCDFLSTGYEDRLALRVNLFGRQPALLRSIKIAAELIKPRERRPGCHIMCDSPGVA